jgi:spore germination protein YaaH
MSYKSSFLAHKGNLLAIQNCWRNTADYVGLMGRRGGKQMLLKLNILKFNKLIIIFSLFIAMKAFAFENLVYTWRGFPNEIAQGLIAINDLKDHSAQIDILSSQAFHINEKGTVYGSLNPQMVQIAKAANIKIMPLVGNGNFDRNLTHLFLTDSAAQDRAINSILQLCKQNNFYGVQIDFEGMSFMDRDAFTHFYQKISGVLHQNGFKISIALIPMLTDAAPANSYLKARYEGWSGVYDYKTLAKYSDFVTLMAYDQHGSISTPGPMAGISWDETIIQYALKYIPADKVSLGIPWHSGYWYTDKDLNAANGNPFHAISVDLAYKDMVRILKDKNAVLRWDDEDKIHYAIYRSNFLYEYIFVEDAASFKAKLELVKKYKLRGISNWCLGEEDPAVWNFFKLFAKS